MCLGQKRGHDGPFLSYLMLCQHWRFLAVNVTCDTTLHSRHNRQPNLPHHHSTNTLSSQDVYFHSPWLQTLNKHYPEVYEMIKSGALFRAWEFSWLLLQSQLPAHTFPSLLPTYTASLSWQIAYFPSSSDSCYCRRQHSIKLHIKGGKELPPFNSSWTLGESKYSSSFLCDQWHGTSECTVLSARYADVLKEINSGHAIPILCRTECVFPASYTNFTTICLNQKGEVRLGYQVSWISIWVHPLIEEWQSFQSFKSDQLFSPNSYAHKDRLQSRKSSQLFPSQHVPFATLPQQKSCSKESGGTVSGRTEEGWIKGRSVIQHHCKTEAQGSFLR